MKSTRPAATSPMACGLALYITPESFTPPSFAMVSDAMSDEVLAIAYVRPSGRDRASASRSASDFAGESAPTTTMNGRLAVRATGSKSFTGSYWSDL